MKSIVALILAPFLVVAGAFGQAPTAAIGKVPALRVQPSVGTHQRQVNGSFYQKTMEIKPKVLIEGASRMLPIPALEATMLIVTMDTRSKYTAGQPVYDVNSKDNVAVPAVTGGERRQFEFPASTVQFDSYRDSSNVGGKVYKYFVFGLRDPETGNLVDFQTNFPELASLCKAHPERRDGFLKLAKSEKFPELK